MQPATMENITLLEFITKFDWKDTNYTKQEGQGALLYIVNTVQFQFGQSLGFFCFRKISENLKN